MLLIMTSAPYVLDGASAPVGIFAVPWHRLRGALPFGARVHVRLAEVDAGAARRAFARHGDRIGLHFLDAPAPAIEGVQIGHTLAG